MDSILSSQLSGKNIPIDEKANIITVIPLLLDPDDNKHVLGIGVSGPNNLIYTNRYILTKYPTPRIQFPGTDISGETIQSKQYTSIGLIHVSNFKLKPCYKKTLSNTKVDWKVSDITKEDQDFSQIWMHAR